MLGVERLGVRDNFFSLGGHSLLATGFVARLRERHGLDVPLQLVFDAVDLRDLAGRIVDRALAAATGDLLDDVEPLDSDPSARLLVVPRPPYEPPETPVEEWLTSTAAEVLGCEQVGVRDNFFTLGGHSLLATAFVARLRERYGLDVPLETVFDAADFRDLADRIVEQELAAAGGLPGEEDA